MAKSVNKVTLLGRLSADPEIRELGGQKGRVANLSLVTGENCKDKQTGEWRERSQWHRVAIFNQALVEVVERKLHKGSEIEIEGQLENRKWVDKQNIERYATEIVVRPSKGALKVLYEAPRKEANAEGAPAHPTRTTASKRKPQPH